MGDAGDLLKWTGHAGGLNIDIARRRIACWKVAATVARGSEAKTGKGNETRRDKRDPIQGVRMTPDCAWQSG